MIKKFDEFETQNENTFQNPNSSDASFEDMESVLTDMLRKLKSGAISVRDGAIELKKKISKGVDGFVNSGNTSKYPLSGAQTEE